MTGSVAPSPRDTVAILDFGSQYTQLIARRLRELQVYSEILPPGTKASELRRRSLRGIVLSGGPDSVYAKGAPRCDPRIFDLNVPVLGICYGMQLMSHVLGGKVKPAGRREYGHASFDSHDAMDRNREQARSLRASRLRELGADQLDVHEFELSLAHLRVPELA